MNRSRWWQFHFCTR